MAKLAKRRAFLIDNEGRNIELLVLEYQGGRILYYMDENGDVGSEVLGESIEERRDMAEQEILNIEEGISHAPKEEIYHDESSGKVELALIKNILTLQQFCLDRAPQPLC